MLCLANVTFSTGLVLTQDFTAVGLKMASVPEVKTLVKLWMVLSPLHWLVQNYKVIVRNFTDNFGAYVGMNFLFVCLFLG